MESLVTRILKDDWSSIQKSIEQMISDKVKAKIDEKGVGILAQLNNITADQMKAKMA